MRQNTTTHRYDEAFKMNLQLFAAPEGGDGSAAEAGEGAGGSAGAEQNPAGGEERSYTRAEMQAEIDRVLNARLARYTREAEKRIKEAQREGERVARMSEAERAEHERQQAEAAAQERENALSQREAEITRRELRADALDKLAARELPRELADLLNYESADACDESIESVEKVFRAAVQAGIDERIKASAAPLKHGGEKAPAKGVDQELAERIAGARASANARADEIIKQFRA